MHRAAWVLGIGLAVVGCKGGGGGVRAPGGEGDGEPGMPPVEMPETEECVLTPASAVPAAAADGATVQLAGTIGYDGTSPGGDLLLEVLRHAPSGEWTKYNYLCGDPERFTLTLPEGMGQLHLALFQDIDSNGPSVTDPAGITAEPVEIADADVTGVALTLALDVVFGALEDPLFLMDMGPGPDQGGGEGGAAPPGGAPPGGAPPGEAPPGGSPPGAAAAGEGGAPGPVHGVPSDAAGPGGVGEGAAPAGVGDPAIATPSPGAPADAPAEPGAPAGG